MRAITTNEFIERSNKIHNNKYAYDKTDLENKLPNGKVIITCPTHGDFEQHHNNHLRGIGCPKCANNTKKTTEDAIREIKRVHGDKYIVPSDFKYLGNKNKIHMVCPLHGDFYPIYTNFVIKGNGCKKCTCHMYSPNEFIEDIKNIYGDSLITDETKFSGFRNKVIVRCNKCGKTHQLLPQRLLDGHFKCGCTFSPYTILEGIVAHKLDEYGIDYEFQYKASWLIHKEQLSIDFYLPKYNIGIECQGRFHFEPYKTNDERCIKNYEIQSERDRLKYNLCDENNIKILYFSNKKVENYISKVYDNVEELLKEIIK